MVDNRGLVIVRNRRREDLSIFRMWYKTLVLNFNKRHESSETRIWIRALLERSRQSRNRILED